MAMAEVRAYNSDHPGKPLAVRLRVWGGFMAPEWAKAIGGPPIATSFNEKTRLMGRFWSPEYRAAWRSLQEKLAAKYDSWPLIREVSMTSCMSQTAEPFYVPTEDTVQKPIRAAGFTEAAYKDCLRGGLADYAAWRRTRIVLSVNPLRTEPKEGAGDSAFTEQIMRDCRKSLGRRCVFDNHNLDNVELTRPLLPIYALMKKLGPEIVFQTYRTNPKDFEGTIRMGVEHGAYCLGCCWFLMALLFFGGVMNLYWIGGIAAYVLLEKVLPLGHWLGYAVGVALIGMGVFLLATA